MMSSRDLDKLYSQKNHAGESSLESHSDDFTAAISTANFQVQLKIFKQPAQILVRQFSGTLDFCNFCSLVTRPIALVFWTVFSKRLFCSLVTKLELDSTLGVALSQRSIVKNYMNIKN